MEWYIYLLAILGGFTAGFINTLAGSGSLITLPILIFLGLPANIANGTNRLGVLLQTLVAVFTFHRRGNIRLKGSHWLILPAILGALPGAYLAVDIDDTTLRYTIAAVMLIMLIPVFMNSEKWLREQSDSGNAHKRLPVLIVFFIIGFYGGFLQAGVGIFLLSAMVLLANFTINHSNALKNLIVLCFTIPAFIIFIMNDQVDWWLGGIVATGQVFGGWSAARFATGYKNAGLYIRWLLVVVILLSVVELFNLRDLLMNWY